MGAGPRFMPRPFENLAGNGCHIHCSLWSGDKNLFEVPKNTTQASPPLKNMLTSEAAWHFLAGVVAKAPAFCAITNPTVNSYKRLNGAATTSGSTWSPNRVSWSGNNRSHMVRIPEPNRFEVRLADGAANPYLLPAVMLACGLWGMDNKIDPSKCFFPSTVNMYAIPDGAPELANVAELPKNLLDATRALEADKDMAQLLGKELVSAFVKLQRQEWATFSAHLSAWEVETTLDC